MKSTERLVRVQWAGLEGARPRPLGKNARLGAHGGKVTVPVCRLTTSEGAIGFGPARLGTETAYEALGLPLSQLFGRETGTSPDWVAMDYPLWDLAAKRAGLPVHQFVAGGKDLEGGGATAEAVPCYDTSLYFEDMDGGRSEVEVIAEHARASFRLGHRAFKVKVGRGARWMSPEEGLERDVAVVEAVREAVGKESALFADANDGFTLNGAQSFLERCSAADLGWLEEPFHEDPVLLGALREWLGGKDLPVAIADGESATPDDALRLASGGLVDIVQCDILRASFTGWLVLGAKLDDLGTGSAPHHFGAFFGNFVTGHLAGAVRGLRYVEWDEVRVPALGVDSYELSEGKLRLSTLPGFGIELDEERFARAVTEHGFDLALTARETT